MRSENQYSAKLIASPTKRNPQAPFAPKNALPIRTNRPPRAAIRIQVFARLMLGCMVEFSLLLPLKHSLSPVVRYDEPPSSTAGKGGELRRARQEGRVDEDRHDRHHRDGHDGRDEQR